MKYDFENALDRRGKDALAVEGLGKEIAPDLPKDGFSIIPMWIADMNFPTAPVIVDEIVKRAKHPAYGYFDISDDFYDSIIYWHKKRKSSFDITREDIIYQNGVLGGLVSAMNILASKGDSVLVHSPTYIGFTRVLSNNGYNIVNSKLVKDKDNIFRMDFSDMERKIVENNIHVAIMCNPHNPLGRSWEYEELKEMMDLYKKYDVYVISDEIWSDLILFKNKHIPTYSVSEDAKMRTISLYSPSKTFNLAGLIASYAIIFNPYLRDRFVKESSLSAYNSINVLSMHALIGAYREDSNLWLDELIEVIEKNVNYAINYIKDNFKGVEVSRPQATYMLFVDCKAWLDENKMTLEELEKLCWDVGVSLQDGKMFHGNSHLRINLALPFSLVKEAMDRLDRYVFNRKS